MAQKHFVQLQLGSKRYKDKVSTEGCQDVADFKDAIKNKWTNLLSAYAGRHLILFEPDGITEIDPETLVSELFQTPKKPFVVKVDELHAQRPTISRSSHKSHKHRNAFFSSRAFLTNIAVELDKIYPISDGISKGDHHVTIGDALYEANVTNPEPKPEFKNEYNMRLNDFFTMDEWDLIRALNGCVNSNLHSTLPFLSDDCKECVLPFQFNHNTKAFQKIAQKSNVVKQASKLIVKNEGSESGSSPDQDKSL